MVVVRSTNHCYYKYVLLVNGKPANRFTKLKDGDQVMLMPPVAGG